MKHSLVRITIEAKQKLDEMAKADGRSMANMLVQLINKAYVQYKEGK